MPAGTRLYLVDASIYVFRAWFTLPATLTDAEGEPVPAVYGFSDFACRLMEQTRPEAIAFAFDESLTTSFRNDIYPDYKANRETAPEELKRQFVACRELLSVLGLAELGSDRYEADDLIGTLAARHRSVGPVTVVSGDKDLTQVVGPQDEWWDFARDRRLDARGIEEHFGVRPEQIPDQLANSGDKVDNIPGVPGIGAATAAKLLGRFGDIECLLEDLEAVGALKMRGAARLQGLLQDHAETVRLSRRLTGVHTEADLPPRLALQPTPPDWDRAERLFDRLGFGRPRRERWRAALNAAPAG
jgi:5'-3' exonuclease